MKTKYLYQVRLNAIDDGDEVPLWDSVNVIANDAVSAIKKVRLRKGKITTYVVEVIQLNRVDKL